MSHKPKIVRLSVVTIVLAGLCCGFAAMAKRPKAAPDTRMQGEKTVIVNLQQLIAAIENPIQVTSISVKGKRVDLDLPFKATDDWLKDFSVTVKNTSDRTIIGVGLNLEWVARDPADGQHYIPMTPIYAGDQVVFGASVSSKGFPLQPGKSAELSVEQQWYDSHINHMVGTAHVQHRQIPEDIGRKAKLRYEYVGFDNDNIWLNGNYSHRDPSNHQIWLPDQEQKKRISQYFRSQPRILNAAMRAGKMLPECVRFGS